MPFSEDAVRLIRRKSYQDALKAVEDLIMATPTGAVREELTTVNMWLMRCKDRQEQIDAHG